MPGHRYPRAVLIGDCIVAWTLKIHFIIHYKLLLFPVVALRPGDQHQFATPVCHSYWVMLRLLNTKIVWCI
jgi:hypothetical protein